MPNWKSVGTVVDFAVAKASQGTGFNDPLIRQNLAGMRTNAVIPFAYHFLDTNGSGADQYDHFINCVGDVTGVGFALDVEHGGVGSRIVQFLDRHVHRFPGRKILVYSNHGLWASSGGGDLSRYPVVEWHAGSRNGVYLPGGKLTNPAPSTLGPTSFGGMHLRPCMIQFTDKAHVPGIVGDVDGDVWTGTRAQLLELTGAHAPTPVPAPVPVPVITHSEERIMLFARSADDGADAAGRPILKNNVFHVGPGTRNHILGGSELPAGVQSAWPAIQKALGADLRIVVLPAATIAAQWPNLV